MEYIKNIQKQSKLKTGTPATRVRIIEEIFSLCPYYSVKQLYKINALQTKKIKQGQRKPIVTFLSVHKQMAIKNAFNQEALL